MSAHHCSSVILVRYLCCFIDGCFGIFYIHLPILHVRQAAVVLSPGALNYSQTVIRFIVLGCLFIELAGHI